MIISGYYLMYGRSKLPLERDENFACQLITIICNLLFYLTAKRQLRAFGLVCAFLFSVFRGKFLPTIESIGMMAFFGLKFLTPFSNI